MTIGGVLVIAGFIVACIVVPLVYLAFFRWVDQLFTRNPRYDNEPVNEWQPPDNDPEDDGAQAIRRVA
jgi:cell division protein FtsW (lipid II flippase)